MTSQIYQLVVRKGPRPGQVIPLDLDLLTVGRDPLSDIVIEDPEVSRHHASFTQGDEGYLLLDKGSTNGSFVDGERLGGETVKLTPGQVIMFGSTVTLVYQATSETDPLATMVGPAAAVPLPESEAPAIDEAPVAEPELEAMPSFDVPDPIAEDPFEDVEPMPSFEIADPVVEDIVEEPEAMVSFDAPDPVTEDPFDDLDQMPSFEVADAVAEDPFADLEPLAEIEAEVDEAEAFTDDVVEDAAEMVSFDIPESQPFLEEDDDAMATMVEAAPVVPAEEPIELEPLPAFEEPEVEAPAPSFPTFDEPEPAPEVELPADPPPLAPLPAFEAPAPEPLIESPSFAIEQKEEAVAFDSAAPFQDLEPQVKAKPPIQTSGEIVQDEAPDNKTRNIIIGVVAVVALCCLCSIASTGIYFLAFAS